MADGPAGVIWRTDEASTVNGVDYVFRRLVPWRVQLTSNSFIPIGIANTGNGIDQQTIDLLELEEQRIEGVRAETAVRGERTLVYDVPGMLWQTEDDGATLVTLDLVQYVEDAGTVIVDRRGWGGQFGEVEVLETILGEPGQYLDSEAPHQVNALIGQSPVAQRGGTRKVQIVGRTPKAGTAVLQLEDAGNLAQTLPEPETPPDDGEIPVPEFTLAASSENPLTVAEATVTNDTDLEDVGAIVEWEYAISDTEPAGDGTTFGPLALGFGTDVIAVPEVPSGSKVWVRARAFVVSTGERSDWSAWQDITLGPDDDGEGGTLPPFFLELAIDVDGILSATATSLVAAITKVYFVAGLDDGAAPSFADVLAGSTDASGPPFTAASLATMAVGETRTVGAIGEDALGNRTTLVLATKTRLKPDDIDSGVGSGTPGNWSHAFVTEAGGTFVLGAHGTGAEPLGTGKYRRLLRPGSYVRGQATVVVAGAPVAYLDCRVSLDDGATWESDLLGLRVPLKDLDDEIGSNGFKHSVGFAVEVPEDFEGDVLLDAVVVDGNGITIPEILNFIIESTSAEPPPVDTEDDPEETPETPPSGGAFGDLKFWIDAFHWRNVLGVPDDTTVDSSGIADLSGNGNDAVPYGSGTTAPTFKAAGIGGGKPSWRFNGTSDSLRFPIPSTGQFTIYFVLDNIVVTVSATDRYPNGNQLLSNQGSGSGQSFGIAIMGDGKISYGVGENFFVNTTASRKTVNAWNDSDKHLHTFIRGPFGTYRFWVDGADQSPGGENSTGAPLTEVPHVYIAFKPGVGQPTALDLGEILWYNVNHTPTEIAVIAAGRAAKWEL